MDATVVLVHRLPDGSEHFDWLLQRPTGGPLITFRLTSRPDLAPPWNLAAERLPDHRDAYLTYEGELSANRGHVARVARGECRITLDRPDLLRAAIRFAAASGELMAMPSGNSLWELILRPTSADSGG